MGLACISYGHNAFAQSAAPQAQTVALQNLQHVARAHQPITLTFTTGKGPAANVPITALYYKNTIPAIEHQQSIGATNTTGQLQWIPTEAGVVQLTWPTGNTTFSVIYDKTPWTGFLVAIGAGIILFGGSLLFISLDIRDASKLK